MQSFAGVLGIKAEVRSIRRRVMAWTAKQCEERVREHQASGNDDKAFWDQAHAWYGRQCEQGRVDYAMACLMELEAAWERLTTVDIFAGLSDG